MATAKYRVIDIKGAYMSRDPAPQLLSLGADHSAAAVYGIRAPVFELLVQGAEIETDGPPGPHLEPLNEEARERMAAYWFAHPDATLDPTRKMPLGQDPMGGRSIEQLVSSLLDGMDRDAAAKAANAPAQGSQDNAAMLQALAEGQAAMTAALTALLTAQGGHASPPAGKGRAG